jgi:hypothetical protein
MRVFSELSIAITKQPGRETPIAGNPVGIAKEFQELDSAPRAL